MFNTDFNQDDQQMFDLIPNGVIAPVVMTIRPGNAGDSGWFTQSQTSDALMLNCEFTVSAGPFARRKFWQNMTLFGGKTDESGNSIAGKISRATLRAILESARGIIPSDFSENAKRGRMVAGPGDFNGMEFVCKVGIQKGQNGYSDKNQISVVITPDKKEYSEIKAGNFEQTAAIPTPASASAPSWANNPTPQAQTTSPPSNTQKTPIPAWAQ